MGERGAAAAAAPAIDERPPGAWALRKRRIEVMRDVAADQRGAYFLGIERGHLLVDGTHARALLIVQHRAVERAGDMVLREFGRGAHVDYLVKVRELCYGDNVASTQNKPR